MALRSLKREMKSRIADGIFAAVKAAANIYQAEVSAKIYPPSSAPGEFPALRSGQGAENVEYELNFFQMIGGFGVRGPDTGFGPLDEHLVPGGMHLAKLAKWPEGSRRLGPEEVFFDNLRLLRQEFQQATQTQTRSPVTTSVL